MMSISRSRKEEGAGYFSFAGQDTHTPTHPQIEEGKRTVPTLSPLACVNWSIGHRDIQEKRELFFLCSPQTLRDGSGV